MSAPNGDRLFAALVLASSAGDVGVLERAAIEYDRATAERIAKLEAENAELRKAYVLASETTAATVKENCALRERIAQLEGDLTLEIATRESVAKEREDLRERLATRELALANERARANDATDLHAQSVAREMVLRERLAKLETVASVACVVRDLLDSTGNPLASFNLEFASLDRALDDLAQELQLTEGA